MRLKLYRHPNNIEEALKLLLDRGLDTVNTTTLSIKNGNLYEIPGDIFLAGKGTKEVNLKDVSLADLMYCKFWDACKNAKN